MNPFIWLRRKAAEAVCLGTADGMRAITPDGEEPPCDLAELRALLASAAEPRALAAHSDGEEDAEPVALTKKGRSK